jgi:hypothetical protein
MADWTDVRRVVANLPAVTEEGGDALSWKVGAKSFLWQRPLRKYEVAELGAAIRDAPILAAMVADVADRDALIAEEPAVFFSTSHFKGYPAVLIWLDQIRPELLAEVATDAWLARAPVRQAKAFLAERRLNRYNSDNLQGPDAG